MIIILALLVALVLSAVLSLIISHWGLMTSHYKISSEKLSASFRVVSLADIHGTVFGKDNRRLIRRVAKEEPDLILLPGDLINKYDEDTSDEERLITELVKIAPVYVSPGNHETEYDREHGLSDETGVLTRYARAGA
ncbi:MAG: metallophosphoesterase, partial [Lachnospiraceae bacterium]|nr:metallophosphoesterase [Lachnospiraceae bacterium]